MKNQFNLNVKTPCSKDFNKFSPTTDGGFCGTCQKEVIDFTTMNSQEIINYFKTKEVESTCGRFNSNQLTSYSPKRRRLSFLSGIGLACLSFFSINLAQAQDTKKQSKPSGDNTKEIKSLKFEKNIVVKGHVADEVLPLPGVNIVLEGTNIGTLTDFEGNFEFPEKLKKGDVLVFSYLGMTSQKVVISNEDSASKIELKVNMKMDSCIIMGKVAVKEVYKSKRD